MKSTILVLILLLGALFVVSNNSVSADQDGDYTYTVSDGKATITGYVFNTPSGVITIPSTLGGHPTVAIGVNVFKNCAPLISVTIPDSVTSIGNYAFEACSSLTSVIIGHSVTSIGNWAFHNCSSLINVSIPNRVTSIGNSAFAFCTSLSAVTIGSNVSTIGVYAFWDCSSLTSILFSGQVKPTVGTDWIQDTPAEIRGHALAASDFPSPGGLFNGLMMGAVLGIPGAPRGLFASVGNMQVALNWTAPSFNGGSVISEYKVYRSINETGNYSLVASPVGLIYTDTSLIGNHTYWYKVSAVNIIGEGVNCSAVPALVPEVPSSAGNYLIPMLVGLVVVLGAIVIALLMTRRNRKARP